MVDCVSVLAVTGSRTDNQICAALEDDHNIPVTVIDDLAAVVDHLDSSIDCVVCCASLFDASGPAIVESISGRIPLTPVVVLHETSEQARRVLDAGVDRCVRRTDDPTETASELAAVVRHAVDGRSKGRVISGGNDLVSAALDTLPDIFFVFDLDGTFLQWNNRVPRVTGYSDAAIAEMNPMDFIAPEDVGDVADAIDRVIEEGEAQVDANFLTADGEHIPYDFTGSLLYETPNEPLAICGIGRDIAERKQREQALEQQANRLETLNHINAVIRDVNEALVRASSREEIEQAVCEHFVGDTPYQFAWVGDFDIRSEDVEPRAWAGIEDGYLDERLSSEPREREITAATAIQGGSMIVAQNIADDSEYNPWREAALDRGYRSAAAIPLTYREISYGVLCVYAPRPNAFDETERAVLSELGETIAYAISAAEQRRALISDTVVELELTLTAGPFFVDASAELDCGLSLEGITENSDGELAEFLTAQGADSAAIVSLAEDYGGEATVMTEYDKTSVLRVTTPESSVAALVADRGGVLRDASAVNGIGEVRVELPQDGDVRSFVVGLREAYPDIEVRAQRERDRMSTRGLEFRESFDEALTDRQREVLETAYLAGYFDWPRGSTAEEIAESIGISAPTFHEHIRRIQQKLLTTFFETNPPTAR